MSLFNSVRASSSLEDEKKYWVKKEGGRTLGIYDRLVAGICGHLELLDQSKHLCAWFHVVVTSAPGGDSALAGFLTLFIRDGLFILLA